VPRIPVKINVNSAVAIAELIDRPANRASAGISRIPPTPTVPISVPTINATIINRIITGSITLWDTYPISLV
jgi:hypothetical protein